MLRTEVIEEIQRRARVDGLAVLDIPEGEAIVAILIDRAHPEGAVALSMSGAEEKTEDLLASRYDNAIKVLRAGNASN